MELTQALLALSRLDRLPRTGWIQAGVPDPESVAGHTLGVAHLALALAPKVEPGLDLARVLSQALLHDAPEALSGDLPRAASRALPEGAKAHMEKALAGDLLAEFPDSAHAALEEYSLQESAESRFVRACDRLQLALTCLGLQRAGQGNLESFWQGLQQEDWSEFQPIRHLWQGIAGDSTFHGAFRPASS